MKENAPDMDSQQLLAAQVRTHLRQAASAADAWDVVHRPETPCLFPARVRAARLALRQLESNLARTHAGNGMENPAQSLPRSAVLDLQSNFRLLRAAVVGVSENPRDTARLPRIDLPPRGEEPRIAGAAALYLRAVEGTFSATTFSTFIQELQTNDPLTVNELWNLPAFLQFVLLELLLGEAGALLYSHDPAAAVQTQVHLKSLRSIGHTDWSALIEPLIIFDETLRQDPAGAYASMDFESREAYCRRIAFIARHSDCTEPKVAQTALELAQQGALHSADESRMQLRRKHIGYYLVDKGFPQLARRVGFHPPFIDRVRSFIRAHADDFYITGIQLLTILFIAAVIFPLLPHASALTGLIVAFLVVLLPVTQDAVDLVNNSVTALFNPDPLPKLDFSKAIPAACATLVAVPSLLLNEKQVRDLVTNLEVRFLANRDPHLHFALLTDLPDSVSKPHENDSHPLVELAIQLIDALNEKYAAPRDGYFLLLHRHRTFNRRQGVWMGWERKRGKLLDLNKLLTGEYDAFPIKAGRLEALHQVRYILTLDSDSQLPRGAAARLIGAMAHPLNQAVIDPRSRIVTAGYGILQPRVGIAVQSVSRSRLASIYSGQTGFDIYARAVSDAYQDLFGEGIFTGKGIYEVETLHAVLDRRFPRNALLSHDLIEGAYARAGLATDIELIDDYPSHYSAYSRRKHRWVRGDWQIVQWIFSRVPEESGRRVRNPISDISRWKVFDNLRRSLVDPFLFILFVAGWLWLPGGPLYWTVVSLLLLIFPTLVQLGFGLGRALAAGRKGGAGEAFAGFGRAMLVVLLNFSFLPHQTLLAIDAVVRSLVRRFITGERLLEWETAAQAETQSARRTPVDRYLALTPLVAAGLAALVYFFARHHRAIVFAAPILVLWGLALVVTAWLNRPPRDQHKHLGSSDAAYLLSHALRIWRYFHQFGAERHNYLIPDNVEEAGLHEASRVSPTNVGLLLNARQAACELGFLTTPEFIALTQQSLATITRLEKFQGHLYNWYDTQTLRPLDASPFVSSVDSGNFLASLYTLHAGAQELLQTPLLTGLLFSSLRAHWQRMLAENAKRALFEEVALPAASASMAEWIAWLPEAEAALSAASAHADEKSGESWWLVETHRRVTSILELLRDYIPWMQPEYAPLRKMLQPAIDEEAGMPSLEEAIPFAEALDARLKRAWAAITERTPHHPLGEQLRASLPVAQQNLRSLAASLRAIAQDAERLAEETDLSFLMDPNRQILSVGYDTGAQKLHESCYDMLASEARIATFLAIARGELPQQSWFRLARQHAHAFGRFLLLSWTGTMFEYLMPALWMQSYPDTLISRTQAACVDVQRAFARSLGIPWGISESGNSRKDDAGHYAYHAYGIPQAALFFEATAGPVVSPYSTFLALSVDAGEALRNLRHMELAGWVGSYGFYEAGDYINSPGHAVLVREWMAHHQGMSLLAVVNLLRNNAVQRWFHLNPLVQSAELLLHEIPVRKAVLKAAAKEFAPLAT
ncbi:MAG: glycosyl transferase [Acidobacteriota bacterium]|nr:glycosyl transferase [Acidobacteriota bacterium]